MSEVDFASLPINALRSKAREWGVGGGGKKAEIIERLSLCQSAKVVHNGIADGMSTELSDSNSFVALNENDLKINTATSKDYHAKELRSIFMDLEMRFGQLFPVLMSDAEDLDWPAPYTKTGKKLQTTTPSSGKKIQTTAPSSVPPVSSPVSLLSAVPLPLKTAHSPMSSVVQASQDTSLLPPPLAGEIQSPDASSIPRAASTASTAILHSVVNAVKVDPPIPRATTASVPRPKSLRSPKQTSTPMPGTKGKAATTTLLKNSLTSKKTTTRTVPPTRLAQSSNTETPGRSGTGSGVLEMSDDHAELTRKGTNTLLSKVNNSATSTTATSSLKNIGTSMSGVVNAMDTGGKDTSIASTAPSASRTTKPLHTPIGSRTRSKLDSSSHIAHTGFSSVKSNMGHEVVRTRPTIPPTTTTSSTNTSKDSSTSITESRVHSASKTAPKTPVTSKSVGAHSVAGSFSVKKTMGMGTSVTPKKGVGTFSKTTSLSSNTPKATKVATVGMGTSKYGISTPTRPTTTSSHPGKGINPGKSFITPSKTVTPKKSFTPKTGLLNRKVVVLARTALGLATAVKKSTPSTVVSVGMAAGDVSISTGGTSGRVSKEVSSTSTVTKQAANPLAWALERKVPVTTATVPVTTVPVATVPVTTVPVTTVSEDSNGSGMSVPVHVTPTHAVTPSLRTRFRHLGTPYIPSNTSLPTGPMVTTSRTAASATPAGSLTSTGSKGRRPSALQLAPHNTGHPSTNTDIRRSTKTSTLRGTKGSKSGSIGTTSGPPVEPGNGISPKRVASNPFLNIL